MKRGLLAVRIVVAIALTQTRPRRPAHEGEQNGPNIGQQARPIFGGSFKGLCKRAQKFGGEIVDGLTRNPGKPHLRQREPGPPQLDLWGFT